MKYLKMALLRGLVAGGFGPVIAGIVYFAIDISVEGFSLSGLEVMIGIISSYMLAFVCAGASVFNEIEGWSVLKSLFWHFVTYYVSYVVCYLVNSWIPFSWVAVGIFTAVFVATYFIIWLSIYFSIKAFAKKLNKNTE